MLNIKKHNFFEVMLLGIDQIGDFSIKIMTLAAFFVRFGRGSTLR